MECSDEWSAGHKISTAALELTQSKTARSLSKLPFDQQFIQTEARKIVLASEKYLGKISMKNGEKNVD